MTLSPAKRALVIWVAPTLILVLVAAAVTGYFRINPRAASPPAERAAFLKCLRSGLEDRAPGGDARKALRGMKSVSLVVRIYSQGKTVARLHLREPNLAAACELAAAKIAVHSGLVSLPSALKKTTSIQVDRIIDRGPLLRSPQILASLAVHPALDGVGVRIAGADYLLLPSETIDSNLLSSNRPLSFVPDFVFGFDNRGAEELLRRQAELDKEEWAAAEKEYFRFRTESFVESADDAAGLLLARGHPPPPEMTAETLRAGALAGGRYLVDHMAPSGRYIYLANLATGQQSDPARGGYSLPRHAGTTYFLAELYRITQAPFLLEPIERGIGHLADLVVAGGCGGTTASGADFVCVSDRGQPNSDLGSTALAVVALAEYKRATGSSKFEELMTEMGEFLLYMQREDGSFAHRYDVPTRTIDQDVELLYYSGEATLALARLYVVTGDERYLKATESGLDWLVNWYDFFLGGFFYGEEHWTCIAAEAISETLFKEEYWDFCSGYGKFLRDHQSLPGEFQDQSDWAGAYYFTPFLAPQNTPAGSRTEAMISTYLLGSRHGREDQELLQQVTRALRFSLSQQLRADTMYRVPPSVRGLGAVSGSPIDRAVRIDYVQHVCSAMIRGSEILRKSALGGESPKGAKIK